MAMTGDNGRGMTDQERDEFLQSGQALRQDRHDDGRRLAGAQPGLVHVGRQLVPGRQQGQHQPRPEPPPRPSLRPARRQRRPAVHARVGAGEAEFTPDDFDWRPDARDMVLRYLGPEGMDVRRVDVRFRAHSVPGLAAPDVDVERRRLRSHVPAPDGVAHDLIGRGVIVSDADVHGVEQCGRRGRAARGVGHDRFAEPVDAARQPRRGSARATTSPTGSSATGSTCRCTMSCPTGRT